MQKCLTIISILRFFHWGYLPRKLKCPAAFLFLFPVFPFLFTASVTSWNTIDSTKVNLVKNKKEIKKIFFFLWIHNRFLSPHPRLVSNKILGGPWLFPLLIIYSVITVLSYSNLATEKTGTKDETRNWVDCYDSPLRHHDARSVYRE